MGSFSDITLKDERGGRHQNWVAPKLGYASTPNEMKVGSPYMEKEISSNRMFKNDI